MSFVSKNSLLTIMRAHVNEQIGDFLRDACQQLIENPLICIQDDGDDLSSGIEAYT